MTSVAPLCRSRTVAYSAPLSLKTLWVAGTPLSRKLRRQLSIKRGHAEEGVVDANREIVA